MLDVQAIRRGLADSLRSYITVTPSLNVYAYMPDVPVLPCIAVTADDPFVNYSTTMGANPAADLRLLVHIVSAGRAEDAQVFIDEMLSAGSATTASVFDAINRDRTLDGLVDMVVPGSARFIPEGEQNAARYEALVPVEVWTRQT